MSNKKRRPDIRATSTVRARELRFHSAPEVEVGTAEGAESVSMSKRSGFPKPVRAGVDYSDVRIEHLLSVTIDSKSQNT